MNNNNKTGKVVLILSAAIITIIFIFLVRNMDNTVSSLIPTTHKPSDVKETVSSKEHVNSSAEIEDSINTESSVDIDSMLQYLNEPTQPTSDTIVEESSSATVVEEPAKDELIPALIQELFHTTDWESVSSKKLGAITSLAVCKEDNGTYSVVYSLDNGYSDIFYSECTDVRTSDLKALPKLDSLYIPDCTLQPGDLDGLDSLNDLTCKNSPEQLTAIVAEPGDLTNLSLTLPKGTTSLDGLEQFGSVTRLTIVAEESEINDATPIGSLSKVWSLRYSDSGTVTDFSFLGSLPAISNVELSAPGLTDLSFLKSVRPISSLSIHNSGITDLNQLPDFAGGSLTYLNLSSNSFITDYSALIEMQNLTSLKLNDNGLEDISFLSSMENLVRLDLGNNKITNVEPLKTLPNLEYLDISGTSVKDTTGLESVEVVR